MIPEAMKKATLENDDAGASNRDAGTPQRIRKALLRTFFTGLSWTAAARGLTVVGTAARYIVFVRLLKPFDFGVIATATMICSLLLAATDPMMEQALVQVQEDIDPYLDTLMTTYFIRSLILGGMLVAFARPLGNFFHLGDAYPVFWAMVPLLILRSIQSPRIALLYRRLDFHLVTLLNVSEVVASFVFGLVAVLYWRDWRGLVFSVVVGALVRVIQTYWLFPYWPRPAFSLTHAKAMLSFGLWFSFGTVCDYVSKQFDILVVGRLLGPGSLGVYQMALRAGEMPVSEFTMSTFQVTFPMVARLRTERRARFRLLRSVSMVVGSVGLIYAVFIFAFGRVVVLHLFGPDWVQAVSPLKVLCIYGLLQGFISVGRSFLSGLGKPEKYVIPAAARALVLAIAIYPLTVLYGPTGAAGAGVISIIVALPIMGYLLQQME